MIILIVLLTIAAMVFGLYRNLQRRQYITNAAFKQLNEVVSTISETAGKYVEAMRETRGEDLPEFTQINQLRWQTTSRKVSVEKKAQALNQLVLLFGRLLKQQEHQNKLTYNPQLKTLHSRWNNLLEELETEKEGYNFAVTEYNTIIHKFPYRIFSRILRILPKTLIQISH
jgi:hypothetical protein